MKINIKNKTLKEVHHILVKVVVKTTDDIYLINSTLTNREELLIIDVYRCCKVKFKKD